MKTLSSPSLHLFLFGLSAGELKRTCASRTTDQFSALGATNAVEAAQPAPVGPRNAVAVAPTTVTPLTPRGHAVGPFDSVPIRRHPYADV